MRHPLNWLLRLVVPESDRQAILGDLEEEYRSRVRPARSWPAAQAWYIGQVIAAAWSFAGRQTVMTSVGPRSAWRVFDAGDVRYVLRRWRRRPAFGVTAVLTLGLGIGAATAMFSVVDAVLLQPLSWPDADRLAVVHAVYPERRSDPRYATTWNRSTLHYPAWDALRRASSFEDVAVWETPSLSMTIDEARTELVEVMDVSSNFLPMLGVRLAHGRNFSKEDDEQDTYRLILSYEAWQRRFGGRLDVIGKPSAIAYASDTHTPPWTVIGVLEPGFTFEGWKPELLRMIGGNARPNRLHFSGDFRALGRLAPDVSIDAASAEAAALIQASQPSVVLSGRVVPLAEEQLGSSARPLWLLFGAASILLLVACTNVAGLLLGENRARRHETAIRLALGVTRGRIVGQLVVEHAILALAGTAAGLVLATWLTHTLVALAPAELPRLDAVRIDWRIALFALAGGGVTMLAFGIVPALTLARTRAAEMLTEGSREASPTPHVAQRTVVIAEIALAALLVVGASLLGETMFRLLSQPLGFDPSNVVVVDTRFTGSYVPAGWVFGTRGQGPNSGASSLGQRMKENREAQTAAVLRRLSELPGVVQAAAMGSPPFSSRPPVVASGSPGVHTTIRVDGRPSNAGDRVALQTVSAKFAQTLRIPLLAGRDLEPADGPNVALVSREFERRYFADGAVGRRFEYMPVREPSSRAVYEVVGVIEDVKRSTFADDPLPTFYAIGASSRFVLQTAADPTAVLPSIKQAIAEVDPKIVVVGATTLVSRLANVIAAERFRATLSTAFACAALLLAAVGLYGVAARRVADRRRELGIRIALGARPGNLQAMVLRDGLVTVGLGLAVGLPSAFAASQVTRTFLFGVSPTSPHIFLLASLVLTIAALVATFLPARHASRVDPILALRD